MRIILKKYNGGEIVKKHIKRFLCVVVVFCTIFALCACKSDPFCGNYNVESVEIGGQSFKTEDAYANGASIELKDVNLCTLKLDGNTYEGTWSSDGSSITVTLEAEASKGTIEGNTLKIDLYGTGMTMVCVRK
ncbi:MAG: hypothetical protein MJ131_10870 [Lachnospiraceae bacterium]|nr:hypothetical protein [Lachnospiraceae bacterium]